MPFYNHNLLVMKKKTLDHLMWSKWLVMSTKYSRHPLSTYNLYIYSLYIFIHFNLKFKNLTVTFGPEKKFSSTTIF